MDSREADRATWRTGRKVGRTIYRGDELIGVMDTPELARQVVEAVSGAERAAAVVEAARAVERDLATRDGREWLHRDAGFQSHWMTLRAKLTAHDSTPTQAEGGAATAAPTPETCSAACPAFQPNHPRELFHSCTKPSGHAPPHEWPCYAAPPEATDPHAECRYSLGAAESRERDAMRHLACLRNRVHDHNVTDACTGEPTCWCIDCKAVRDDGADIWDTPAVERMRSLRADLERVTRERDEAHWRLNDADGALQDAGVEVKDERFDLAIERLAAERDAARADLAACRGRAEKAERERDNLYGWFQSVGGVNAKEHLDAARADLAACREENERLRRERDLALEGEKAASAQAKRDESWAIGEAHKREEYGNKLDAARARIGQLEAAVTTLFDAIAHGDEKHRRWLKAAIAAHFSGAGCTNESGCLSECNGSRTAPCAYACERAALAIPSATSADGPKDDVAQLYIDAVTELNATRDRDSFAKRIIEVAHEVDAWREKLTAPGGLNPPGYCPPLERLHSLLLRPTTTPGGAK